MNTSSIDMICIERCNSLTEQQDLEALASLLKASVDVGASIGFLAPLDRTEARAYWEGVAVAVAGKEISLWLARCDGSIVGTVQLAPSWRANGANRAEVQKLMVHPEWRCRGIARQLMQALEADATQQSRHLLFLDTEAGSAAEALYQSLGFQRLGEIPSYASTPSGALHPTAIYFKDRTPSSTRQMSTSRAFDGVIRLATHEDASSMVGIYNHYILNTTVSFETEAIDAAEMTRRMQSVADAKLPWLVAEQNGKVLGYAYATPWRVRAAYRHSVETSVYLANTQVGRGLGSQLYQTLLSQLHERGIHAAIGGVALPNEASVALHEKMGFQRTALFREVGLKFGRWIDVAYWQRLL